MKLIKFKTETLNLQDSRQLAKIKPQSDKQLGLDYTENISFSAPSMCIYQAPPALQVLYWAVVKLSVAVRAYDVLGKNIKKLITVYDSCFYKTKSYGSIHCGDLIQQAGKASLKK